MASNQPSTSSAIQSSDDREHLFRLQMLIIDGGLLVLRNYVDQILASGNTTFGACLTNANEKSTIIKLRNKETINDVQYDMLYPSSGDVSTSDLDITLIVCLLRNLKCFGLNRKFKWNVKPAQCDTSIEADICRLTQHRNNICHIPNTCEIGQNDFTKLWQEIEQILVRINSSAAIPIPNLIQTIWDYKATDLDKKTAKRLTDAIEKWKKIDENMVRMSADINVIKETLKTNEQREVKMKKAKLENESLQ